MEDAPSSAHLRWRQWRWFRRLPRRWLQDDLVCSSSSLVMSRRSSARLAWAASPAATVLKMNMKQ
jgi:hypothetical protein